MPRHNKLISFILAAVFSFTGTAGQFAGAQELAIRPEWLQALYSVPPLYRQDTVSLCFLGDVMMHAKQIETAGRGGSGFEFSSYFSHIEKYLSKADIAVANMEFTLAGEPYTGYPCFSAPDAIADHAAGSGIDVFLAANNHILDRGSQGAMRTALKYRELESSKGIRFTGIAEDEESRNDNFPLFIRNKGITIALVNATYGTNLGATEHWPKVNYLGRKGEIQNAMAKAEEADITIVLPHWGPEYQLQHSENQEATAEWLVELGADAIIGTHPHVVQDTSHIDGVPVIYSLGNAVSNMSAKDTQLELMVSMQIVRHGNGDIEMLPLRLTWLWCSRPGGYGPSYTVIPVEEFIGRQDLWIGKWDYDKMVTTYERTRKTLKL